MIAINKNLEDKPLTEQEQKELIDFYKKIGRIFAFSLPSMRIDLFYYIVEPIREIKS